MFQQLRVLSPCLFLLGGCASSTASTVPAHEGSSRWRPLPPSELVDRCRGEAARQCFLEGIQALEARPPEAFTAQNLFAAACDANQPEACQELDRHFHAPAPSAVPSLSQYLPPSGYAVVEFACRVSTEGSMHACERRRSSGSTAQFDTFLTEKLLSAEGSARFVPARVDDAPYETEVRLIYVLRATSGQLVGGSSNAVPDSGTAARMARGIN